MKYMKQLMTEIHKANYITPCRTICLSQDMLDQYDQISKAQTIDTVDYYDGLTAGAYLVGLNTKKFIFYLVSDLTANQRVSIPNDLCFSIIDKSTGKKIIPITSYEVKINAMKNGNYELTNAAHGLACGAIINGNTAITNTASSVSPLNPNTFTAIRDITIQSANSISTLNDSDSKIVCNSPFYLNSLPNGVRDYLIMDGFSSFIINKVGRIKMTGNELWEKVEDLSTGTYSIFFLEYDLMKKDDGADVIISTHFPNTSYASLASGIATPNGIACANTSSDKNGIYIMIENKYMDGRDASDFKNFLRSAYRTNNPVVVIHELADAKIKNITVSDYKLRTFFPYTVYKTNYPNNVALCANLIPQKEV